MKLKFCSTGLLVFLFAVLSSCAKPIKSKPPTGYEKIFKDHDEKKFNWLNKIARPLMPKRLANIYNHSILEPLREQTDCELGFCPKIDIWEYRYLDKDKQLIVSNNPISSKKKHWKNPNEARVIAITLFGEQRLYYDLLLEYLDSIRWVSKVNGFQDQNWGFESFVIRIYAAKRNPKMKALGKLAGEVSDEFIELLLNNGCEVALVDNHMEKVGVDSFFWRFMVVNEKMPENQSIRYLVRDADWKATSLELYAVGDWILRRNDSFTRFQPYEGCIVAVTGSLWGGRHTGDQFLYPNIFTSIMNFPYRRIYGDDEMFLHYLVWEYVKKNHPIESYINPKARKNIRFAIGNPFANSCQEPTQKYCDLAGGHNICSDINLPRQLRFPGGKIGMRVPFDSYRQTKKFFLLDLVKKNSEQIKQALSAWH